MNQDMRRLVLARGVNPHVWRIPRMLAWLALGLFAGLRPSEAAAMTWEGVREDVVVVDASASKVRRRRVVRPPRTALRWLLEARERGGGLPLCP